MTRSGHTYMPDAYRKAQSVMKAQIQEQWPGPPLEGPIALSLRIKGEGRGDTDNIAGAFMDAAQGLVFVDDRVSVIPSLSVSWEKAPKTESKWIIEIRLL